MMTRTTLGLACLVLALMAASCTDAERARFFALGDKHLVQLYSGGKVAKEWYSTGKVECSDGGICSFMNAANGKLVKTTGDITIEVQ